MSTTPTVAATLTLTDAAKYLGISKVTFYRDVAPTAPFVRTLTGHRRYRPADLDRWISERVEVPPPEES
ncbi:MAG: helix-turn-helix domain-containing protein [Gaiellales bacterium]